MFEIWQQEKRSFKEQFEAEKCTYTQTLVNRYVAQQNRIADALIAKQMPSLNDMLPSEEYMTLQQVQFIFEGTLGKGQPAAVAVAEFLRSGVMNEAPFNIIAASMYASLAQKAASGQKRPPNQGTINDVNMVSTLLPYCDGMFVDNECRALWQDIPRDFKLPFTCALFSPNIGDAFLRYLGRL